ncbi:cold shock and DUF1294 domain-containing protein [Rhodoferax sp. BLA1]|uniref:DUF1294 domain-containing protein n=1 Tax=Rhodoferax sp. BLA1 TaxID=2576062 RepID=UPI0015D308D4|nr:cold shock and DUF1294 domain-containing protein [Rhodoferax sp. BLA1]
MTPTRFTGTLTTWHDDRGFGFLQADQGGNPVFVHIKAFLPGSGRPQLNLAYTFEVETGAKGKRAINVAPVRAARVAQATGPSRQRPSAAPWGTATLLVIPVFLVLYAVVAVLWRPPLWVAGAYLGLSLLTFIVYAMDKSAARAQGWRTAESTLHLLALVGGWPGALLAQQWLRHKSRKQEFRAVFWATVLLNVAGLVLLCSPWARRFLSL